MAEDKSALGTLARHVPARMVSWAVVLGLFSFAALVAMVIVAVVADFEFKLAGVTFGRDSDWQSGLAKEERVEEMIDAAIDGLASRTELEAATASLTSEGRVVALIEENQVQTGAVTEASVRTLIAESWNPNQAFRDMHGAVIAFDRSEGNAPTARGACPEGWGLFREAGGRFLVGAGAHSNLDENGQRLADYPAFSDDPNGATGGAEAHTLTIEQMPRHQHNASELSVSPNGEHRHRVPMGSAGGETGSERGGTKVGMYSDTQPSHRHSITGKVNSEGGDSAHNNMPPYIALYFCKKEAQ